MPIPATESREGYTVTAIIPFGLDGIHLKDGSGQEAGGMHLGFRPEKLLGDEVGPAHKFAAQFWTAMEVIRIVCNRDLAQEADFLLIPHEADLAELAVRRWDDFLVSAVKGSANPSSRISPETRTRVIKAAKSGWTYEQISEGYGPSIGSISNIVRKREKEKIAPDDDRWIFKTLNLKN